MFGMKKGVPDEGEIVLCTVTKIYHHSVFVNLDEYGQLSGMLHISEVSPGRIRNLRDFVEEGKKIVCKILSINKEKGHIDLSLRRVTESQKRDKANMLKQEQRAERIIEAVAKKLKEEPQAFYTIVAEAVKKKQSDILTAFEAIANDQAKAEDLVDKKYAKELESAIKSRIKPPEVEIGGLLSLTTYHPEGINHIKQLLKPLVDHQMNPHYIGSGKYRVSTKAPDYKSAEKKMKDIIDEVLANAKKLGGEGSFERLEA